MRTILLPEIGRRCLIHGRGGGPQLNRERYTEYGAGFALEPDTEIKPGVIAIAAFGHPPGQMGLDIFSAEDRLLFLADSVILPFHVEYPDTIGATDHRPEEMVATRMNLLGKAAQHGCLVSTSHFAFPGLGYVAPKGNSWEWRALSDKIEHLAARL